MGRERNTAQQMLALAVEANYVYWHEINPETHELTHVFMSHPEAVKLFRAYPHVVLIDSIYKSNSYNMTLVEVVGVTPVAFVTDRELDLVAALRNLFLGTPHLLCHWHVNHFIESRALEIHKTVHYKDHMLKNPKTGWDTATSWVESTHSLLKAWLKSAHLTLYTMWSWIYSMLDGQHSKIHKKLEDSMSRARITHRLFSLLQGKMSTKNKGSRVHLSDTHPFWRTLEYDNEEAMPKNDNDMLEDLVDKARQSDSVYRKVFLEKLRDILHPEDEDILALAVRENPKGRSRCSATRNKSGFEHSQRKYGIPSTDSSTNVQHMVVNVGSDSYCGFRVLSHALRGGEEDYIQMRDWCLKEITGFDVYKGLFEAGVMTNNGLSKYENTLRRIRFIHQSSCGQDHWMHSGNFFVFASLFNWTICVIAENRYAKGTKEWQCITILPLRSSNEGVPPYGVL
ncbi:hypothetical protein RND81_03G092600 [Saponaria officinalis]|uniref:Protein FAR1-RELATED SEQUENCE n=1 Tax=Saponaria officinalis TaxID=3572 RepID=A0AAW1M526_SAPOF